MIVFSSVINLSTVGGLSSTDNLRKTSCSSSITISVGGVSNIKAKDVFGSLMLRISFLDYPMKQHERSVSISYAHPCRNSDSMFKKNLVLAFPMNVFVVAIVAGYIVELLVY